MTENGQKSYYIATPAAVFSFLLIVDQITKYAVSSHLDLYGSIPLIGNLLKITYITNTGISFGMLDSHPGVVLALQSVLFLVIVIAAVASVKRKSSRLLLIGLAATLAGGIGNLIDRLLHGYVIDFISVSTFNIWNFADMYIIAGCILVGVSLFTGKAGEKK